MAPAFLVRRGQEQLEASRTFPVDLNGFRKKAPQTPSCLVISLKGVWEPTGAFSAPEWRGHLGFAGRDYPGIHRTESLLHPAQQPGLVPLYSGPLWVPILEDSCFQLSLAAL